VCWRHVLADSREKTLDFHFRLRRTCAQEHAEVVLIMKHQHVRTRLDVPVGLIDPESTYLLEDAAIGLPAHELGEVSKWKGSGISSDVNAEELVRERSVEKRERSVTRYVGGQAGASGSAEQISAKAPVGPCFVR